VGPMPMEFRKSVQITMGDEEHVISGKPKSPFDGLKGESGRKILRKTLAESPGGLLDLIPSYGLDGKRLDLEKDWTSLGRTPHKEAIDRQEFDGDDPQGQSDLKRRAQNQVVDAVQSVEALESSIPADMPPQLRTRHWKGEEACRFLPLSFAKILFDKEAREFDA